MILLLLSRESCFQSDWEPRGVQRRSGPAASSIPPLLPDFGSRFVPRIPAGSWSSFRADFTGLTFVWFFKQFEGDTNASVPF